MKLRAVTEGTAFRYFMVAGVIAAVGNFVLMYVDVDRLDLVGVAVQAVFVVIIGVTLITYWDYMEWRTDAE